MMLLSWRLSEVSMPAITMRRRRLDRSNRLSIISSRACRSTFASSPRGNRKPAGTTDARVQHGREARIGLFCRKRPSRYKRRQTSHAPDFATVALPAPLQFLGKSLLIFVTLSQDSNLLGAAPFGVSESLKTVGSRRGNSFTGHDIPFHCSKLVHQLGRMSVRRRKCNCYAVPWLFSAVIAFPSAQ